ncbi:putative extracellular glycosidase [Lachnellula suecica]|uniref:Crh-like protein n=1 Tax=Lachnellula suecica TaxID=602035 RepID=A0A8T9CI29_9HELO|nr:putative extracellular glycosidase [Lachnellula suecica]
MYPKSILALAAASLFCTPALSQTYSSCNPLYSTGCPANTALGKAISVDFTKGSVNSFTATGDPTYDSSGAHFTVAKSGDAPQLTSVFYIMFGKVAVTMKAAPGAGIVSTLVLESDDLDEIDMEWLGADDTEVQTNYFGKGDVTTYNRGAFNPAANNQGEFITYTVEWTQDQITWSVGNSVVRVLTPATADANQYPQTPMRVKFGSWSGGDPSNAAGTIAWARGPTDYSKGPFTMTVQSVAVTDYSTGTQYKYGDTSGSWGSIQAVGGTINGNSGSAGSAVASADVPAVTSASPSIPAGLGASHTDTALQTGWPWVGSATTLATAPAAATSAPGVPSGWIITSSGKVVPANSAAALPTSTPSSSAAQSPLPSSPPSGVGLEVSTGWDDRGFPTTRTIVSGETARSYDQQGFLITTTPAIANAPVSTATGAVACFGKNCGPANKIVGTSTGSTSTSTAAGAKQTSAWSGMAAIGLLVVVAEILLV